jgi:hypothetical protein
MKILSTLFKLLDFQGKWQTSKVLAQTGTPHYVGWKEKRQGNFDPAFEIAFERWRPN